MPPLQSQRFWDTWHALSNFNITFSISINGSNSLSLYEDKILDFLSKFYSLSPNRYSTDIFWSKSSTEYGKTIIFNILWMHF